jgi:uncharacterized protein
VNGASILWKRLDRPGHEAARLDASGDGWTLSGSAVFLHEEAPCDLRYRIVCGPDWRTQSSEVTGRLGSRTVMVRAGLTESGDWIADGARLDNLSGCIDVDLNFSPSTNLLPIRRLGLAVGGVADVRAAWLRFPSFTLEPFAQTYERLDVGRYRYASASGFTAELEVNDVGLVTRYADIWQVEA